MARQRPGGGQAQQQRQEHGGAGVAQRDGDGGGGRHVEERLAAVDRQLAVEIQGQAAVNGCVLAALPGPGG